MHISSANSHTSIGVRMGGLNNKCMHSRALIADSNGKVSRNTSGFACICLYRALDRALVMVASNASTCSICSQKKNCCRRKYDAFRAHSEAVHGHVCGRVFVVRSEKPTIALRFWRKSNISNWFQCVLLSFSDIPSSHNNVCSSQRRICHICAIYTQSTHIQRFVDQSTFIYLKNTHTHKHIHSVFQCPLQRESVRRVHLSEQ